MATDIPDIPQNVDGAVRKPLSKLREAMQVLLGTRGDPLDAALTMRSLLAKGFAKQVGTTPGGPVTYVPVGGTGGSGSGSSTEVDLTPPPNVPDFTASPGLTQIFVEWPAATYTQGNGHKQTNIYAVKKATGDATLPTFSQATRVFSATGALTVASLPSDLSTRWHIWLKYETNDGVESSAPTGGTNGKVAQTGKIGNTDLAPLIIEAQHMKDQSVIQRVIAEKAVNYQQLADGAVRVQHLLVAPKSLIMDPSFEGGAALWGGEFMGRWPATDPIVPAGCPVPYAAAFKGRDSYMSARIPVTAGEQYRITCWVQKNVSLADCGVVTFGFDRSGNVIQTVVASINAFGWQRIEAVVSVDPNVVSLSVAPWNGQNHGGQLGSWFADLQVEKKNDASLIVDGGILARHLSANSIAVNTAAIENGAIINAMLADATIEDAKIKTLSADKITAGRIAVGSYIASAGFNSGYSGWAIWGDGNAEFNNITVRNSTVTGTVYAGAGTIGGIRINAYQFNNDGYVPGTSGFALFSNGGAEFNQGSTFRGTLAVASNSSGVRTELTNAGQQVFNGSNIAVIQLGVF